MTTGETPTNIEGRDGLLIPRLSEMDIWDSYTVLGFMQRLQEANGLDVSRVQGSGERRQPRPFNNILMIGKVGTKPLVVIQGSYNPRPRADVESDLRSNKQRQEWGQWPATTTGYLRHAIHVLPVSLEESIPRLEVRRTITEGGSSGSWGSGYEPSLYVDGERIHDYNFYPKSGNFSEADQQQGRAALSDYLKQTVASVVALLK